MASSSADKVQKDIASTTKTSESSSPTRRPLGNVSAPKRSPSRKYSSRGPVEKRAASLSTANLPAFLFSSSPSTKRSSTSAVSDATQSAEKKGKRRSSGGDMVFTTGPPYALRGGSRLMEKPYGKELSYERSPRKSSFAASLENLSVGFSTPLVSPPQVSALSSPPSLDFGDVPGISASPLVDDDERARSELQEPGWSSDRGTPQSQETQKRDQHLLQETNNEDGANGKSLQETHTDDETKRSALTSSIPPPPVGDAFTSYLQENISLMTNPLYPAISSAGSSPSPFSAPHIDGFNIPAVGINLPNAPNVMSPVSAEGEIVPAESTAAFLQKRKAAAATQRQKGIFTADPNSAASQAIVKRQTQVLSTVQKAKTRLSVLTNEVTKKRRSFRNDCFGRFRRWLYERERKRMMGKGIVLNKLWLASLKEMERHFRISTTIMSSGDIAVAARLYPFSSLVFASWDFHLINTEAATKLRRGIRMQLKEMLADVVHGYKTAAMSSRLISAKRATGLFILWPLLMAANVAIVIQLVTKADQVNEAFGSSYAQALLLSILNVVTPMVIRVLVDMEDFRPSTAERVVLMKLFCVRVLNLGALFYRLFMMLEHTLEIREDRVVIEACLDGNRCLEGFTCCTRTNMTQWNICTDRDIQFCLPACTENAVGIQLLRLIVMTTLINTAYELLYGFGYVWFTSGNKRQLFVEDMAIDVVYMQSLVWVGSCFSPMATVVGFFANLLTWYGMRFSLFRTCGAVEKAHSATRTEVLTYGLLLLTLILSTIPATLNVMQRSSGFCGPVHERISQYTVLTTYVKRAPQGLWLTIQWLVNPAMLLGVILLLVFGVVLLQSKLVQSRQFLSLTKHELGMQRREASERLTRVRQDTKGSQNGQNGTGGSDSGQGRKSLRRASAPPEVNTPPGQVEAVNIPTETNSRQGQISGSLRRTSLDTGRISYPKIN
ncbi:hypothetical protein R1flu_027737 [Riccia fluitans]|uniref:TMC domain-containing protein n=1 Tax=Riccia fluitans TaxID=41844 RepID=A0ABD1XK68_9MARC